MIGLIQTSAGRSAVWVLLFAGLILLTQSGAILHEDIDWDESTFLLMAQSVLDGHLPYVEMFDNKPPMIFFILAGAMAVFGEHLWVARAVGDLSLLATTLGVFALTRHISGSTPAAGAAGILCLSMHTVWNGQYTSTELPALACLIWSLWALAARGETRRGLVLSGVLLSLAVLTRSNLAFVALGLGIGLMAQDLWRGGIAGLYRGRAVWFALAGLMPLAVLIAVYAVADELPVLWLSVVEVPLFYATSQLSLLDVAKQHFFVLRYFLYVYPGTFVPVLVLSFLGLGYVVLQYRSLRGKTVALLLLAFALMIYGILQGGIAYRHYWLHIFPFLAIAGGLACAWSPAVPRLGAWGLVVACAVFSAIAPLRDLHRLATEQDPFDTRHTIRRAAEHIEGQLAADDAVWAFHRHLVLFYLDRAPLLWMATHPDNVARPEVYAPLVAAGRAPPAPLQAIYAAQPRFVVTEDTGRPFWISDAEAFESFMQDYEISGQWEGVVVYRRKPVAD